MKRAGNLFEQIADRENLLIAFYKAARSKRGKREVMLYSEQLEKNILKMQEALLSDNLSVGNYTYFKIYDPKLRTICAAAFEERVLHHAIMNVCAPYFERHLIETTYATRPDKGIYKAIDRAKLALKRYPYVAKFDVRHYFDAIDHNLLKKKLHRIFKDPRLLRVFEQIIANYSTHPGKGIPIGNLTSQYFANHYLSSFDHWCKEQLKAGEYVRYMDDFLYFSSSLEDLNSGVIQIIDYMRQELQLTLKPVIKLKSHDGVAFLGYRLFPDKILLNRRSKKRFKTKLACCEQKLINGIWSEEEYKNHMLPLLAFVQKAYTKGLRRVIQATMESGDNCVLRGGSNWNNARNCRVSNRNNNNPDNRNNNNGLRLAFSL